MASASSAPKSVEQSNANTRIATTKKMVSCVVVLGLESNVGFCRLRGISCHRKEESSCLRILRILNCFVSDYLFLDYRSCLR